MGSEQEFMESSLERCRRGGLEELSRVYAELLPSIQGYLQNLGASAMEAETFASEVLRDCLVGTLTRPPLIQRYHGRSYFATWVTAVARNRYFDFMRGQKMDQAMALRLQADLMAGEEWVENTVHEEHVFTTLRRALIEAFRALSATDAVLLHLVRGHKVDQRILARSLGWLDTKMSRHLCLCAPN
jgi:DNA-directed RNA polymerase specialized sigma24 family protein